MGDSETKPTVFISYARADRARVSPLTDALTAHGYEVWWDALIESGAAFAKTIASRLSAADAVIVVWSATSVVSDWVRDEADHGRQRGRLAPVSLDGSLPPLGFGQYHAVDLSKWRGDPAAPEIAQLVRGLAEVSGREPPARAPMQRPRLSRRTAMIAGGGAVAAAAVGGIVLLKPFGKGTTANSIAVLPFANLSNDPAQAYFSDGLAEEVRSALARNAGLKVAAQTSSNLFRNEQGDAKAVAAKLGVAFVLEGSVRKQDNMVRVAAQLIDAKTGFSSWSQTFDRSLDNVLTVQTEIANTVATALAVRVDPNSKAPGSTANPAAYDAFLKARALYNSDAGEESDRASLAQVEAALALDPKYAAALALSARIQTLIADQYTSGAALRAAYEAAIATAKRAEAIAPDLVDAQIALGNVLFNGRVDVKGARTHYARAAQLGAGDADILISCAFYFALTRQFDAALQASGKALTLDPLNARAWRVAGTVAYARRDYPTALSHWAKTVTLNPKIGFARGMSANALTLLDRAAEARKLYADEPIDLFRLTAQAITENKLGNSSAARQARDELIAKLGDNSLYQLAEIAAQWGDGDAAMAILLRARVAGDAGLTNLAMDPLLDPIRARPAFSDLLKQLGFA